MPPAVPVDIQGEKSEDGKIYERSQQDGEMYSKPTVGIIYPPPEVRSIFSTKHFSLKLFLK